MSAKSATSTSLKPEFYTLAAPIKSLDGKSFITLGVGDVFLFEDEPNELYKVVYREEEGELLARFCFNDVRYSIVPGHLSRIIIVDPEQIKRVMKSRAKSVEIKLIGRGSFEFVYE